MGMGNGERRWRGVNKVNERKNDTFNKELLRKH